MRVPPAQSLTASLHGRHGLVQPAAAEVARDARELGGEDERLDATRSGSLLSHSMASVERIREMQEQA